MTLDRRFAARCCWRCLQFVQIATRLPLFSLGAQRAADPLALAPGPRARLASPRPALTRGLGSAHRRAILVAAAVLLAIPFVWVALKSDIDRKLPRMAVEVALKLSDPPAAVTLRRRTRPPPARWWSG